MVKSKKPLDEEAEQLNAFMMNVGIVDTIREEYQGNFVAIYGQKVIGNDTEYSNLWGKIGAYVSSKELFVGYIPKNDEALVV